MQRVSNYKELYHRIKDIKAPMVTCRFTEEWCRERFPYVQSINELKEQKRAVILAHSYVASDIVLGVADYVGDSYKLSKDATQADCDIILFSAVRFMAETAKVLNPDKRVFITASDPGCSLADSITGDDVKKMKEAYPGYAFICYINTTAEVKALCDVCVTSSNVYDIVENYPNDKILFLPDKLMGLNLIDEMKRRGVDKKIALWDGLCYVHNNYDQESIDVVLSAYPNCRIVAHPECTPEVIQKADYVGSTSQIMQYVRQNSSQEYLILTECGLGARLQAELPEKNFVGSCSICRYMKSNSLENIEHILLNEPEEFEIFLENDTIEAAMSCIEKMFYYAEGGK